MEILKKNIHNKEEQIIKTEFYNHSLTKCLLSQSKVLKTDSLEIETITSYIDDPFLKELLTNFYLLSVKSYHSKNERIFLKEEYSKCKPSSPNHFISSYHSMGWDL
ncbi:hypothetical protein ACTFIV_000438 [Dictyostelium citrinum]